jgi:hypothetical protein
MKLGFKPKQYQFKNWDKTTTRKEEMNITGSRIVNKHIPNLMNPENKLAIFTLHLKY